MKVLWEKDLAVDSPLPWYLAFDKSHFSLSSFRQTAVGRFFIRNMVKIVEMLAFVIMLILEKPILKEIGYLKLRFIAVFLAS